MKERIFIQKAKEQISMKEFVRSQFRQAKIGAIEVQHTPIVTRIVIYTTTPGLIIGSGGERIREIVDALKAHFKIENPQIDVQKISNENLDPNIVAQNIVASIENGVNYKKLGNFYVSKIIDSGAVGCEIIITGKLAGERSRKERFSAGYLKKCGEPAKNDVLKGFAVANPRLGNIGITVMIMLDHPEELAKRIPKPVAAKPEAEKTEGTTEEKAEGQTQGGAAAEKTAAATEAPAEENRKEQEAKATGTEGKGQHGPEQ